MNLSATLIEFSRMSLIFLMFSISVLIVACETLPGMDLITSLASTCRVASAGDTVFNSECVFTFHSPYTTSRGILVNLTTFVATCEELVAPRSESVRVNEYQPHAALYLRIVKQRELRRESDQLKDAAFTGSEVTEAVPCENVDSEAAPSKLGVGVAGGFQTEADTNEIKSTYSIVALGASLPSAENPSIAVEIPYNESTRCGFPTNVTLSADSVINHTGVSIQQDVKAWELEQELPPISKYAENLPFVDNDKSVSPDPSKWRCEMSGDTENLWLNLSDGYVGGGRKNWDGTGGSNGALSHFMETGERFPLVVKLGTITEDVDTADCYSYARDEDGPVKIPSLAQLLSKRGIKVAGLQKTAKSIAEMEVELNATYAFDAITESGCHLISVSGPGLQGLQNLGNSCYINTVVQCLFGGTILELASRYGSAPGSDLASHPLLAMVSPEDAANDMLCQTAKLGSALTSGTFALPAWDREGVNYDQLIYSDPKFRISPRMFKNVVSRDHIEFSTGQQQDAAQFLQYLLEKLDTAEKNGANGGRLANKTGTGNEVIPSSWLFGYRTTLRLECSADDRVKYKTSATEILLPLRIPTEKAEPSAVSGNPDDSFPDLKRQKWDWKDDSLDVLTTKKCAEDRDKNVNYEEVASVSLRTCFEGWNSRTKIDGVRWPHLNNEIHSAMAQNSFATFPRYLFVQLQRYELGNDWIPKKLEVNVDVPENMDIEFLRCPGPKVGEDLVPERAGEAVGPMFGATKSKVNEEALAQLMDMGFSFNGCTRALKNVGGSNVEAATSWIFEHNGDPNFNDPLPEKVGDGLINACDDVDEGAVAQLVDSLACFTSYQVRAALKVTGGALDRAADWLFSHSNADDLEEAVSAINSEQNSRSRVAQHSSYSFSCDDGEGKYTLIGMISHIGKNTGCGHYVCHMKKDDKWIIFNDEKVALSESPPKQHAYVYLFQRDDTIGNPNSSF